MLSVCQSSCPGRYVSLLEVTCGNLTSIFHLPSKWLDFNWMFLRCSPVSQKVSLTTWPSWWIFVDQPKVAAVKAMRNITIKPSTFSAVIGSYPSEVTPQFSRSHQDQLAIHMDGASIEPLFGSPAPGCSGKISDSCFEGNISQKIMLKQHFIKQFLCAYKYL